jgi:superfamily I DNA and RNA helicase
LRLSAPAGSGKTQVARDFYARAAEQSKKVAFICFNRPLAMRFLRSVPAGGTVNTYHGFLHLFLESIGEKVNFAQANSDPKFWPRIQERVLTADIPDSDKFDCLIVDEGQDFEPEWWQILRLFLADDASVLWLEDDGQNLYGRQPVVLDGFVGYRDRRNFRTPVTIARFIQKALEVEFEPANTLPGLGVVVHTYQQPMDQVALIAHRVNELVRVGFKRDDVVVLSCRGLDSSTLRDVDAVGAFRLRRFTGDYDSDNNQIYTDGQLLFDTVFRFKGQQAPAVILMDIDQRLSDSRRWQPVLYCGMTRAMVRLELLVQEGTGLQQRLST